MFRIPEFFFFPEKSGIGPWVFFIVAPAVVG
jgi:hypothetical protein